MGSIIIEDITFDYQSFYFHLSALFWLKMSDVSGNQRAKERDEVKDKLEKMKSAKPQLANIDGMDKTEIAFRLADKDKSGYITKSEFEKMAKNLSKEQIEKVFAKCDKDGDGKINFSEFSSMMAMAKK